MKYLLVLIAILISTPVSGLETSNTFDYTTSPTQYPTLQPKHDLNCAGELRNGDFEASNSFPLNWSNQSMTYGLNTYDMVNVLEMEIISKYS